MTSEIAAAYDGIARKEISLEQRQLSKIIHLRQFNNWIKSILIAKYCPEPYASIFDLACGKGGDIPKWKRKNPNLFILGDISFDSLREAYRKFANVQKECRAIFLGGDIFECRVSDFLDPDIRFSISSCQFAFHYSFRDEKYAMSAVQNLCERLVRGGYILITIPNAARIVKRLREVAPSTVIENSLFRIEREFDLDNIPAFGARYVFDLVDAVDHCPEYLVHPTVMSLLFKKYNCDLVETYEFPEYYAHSIEKEPQMKELYLDLLRRLEMSNTAMTPEEWEVVSLYSFYVYRKAGEMAPGPSRPIYNDPKRGNFKIMNVDTGVEMEEHIELKKHERGLKRR